MLDGKSSAVHVGDDKVPGFVHPDDRAEVMIHDVEEPEAKVALSTILAVFVSGPHCIG